MKNLTELVPQGRSFLVDDEHPYFTTLKDIKTLASIGKVLYRLLAVVLGRVARMGFITEHRFLESGIPPSYVELGITHPHINPFLTRVDLMLDADGCYRVAEVDPANKHGIGFMLALRYESGVGERQKLLSLLAPFITDDLAIVLSRRESFFCYEQRYFAQKLAEHTGKQVRVIPEEKLAKLRDSELILDLPICSDEVAGERLSRIFRESPGRFLNPPRHWMGNKSLMAIPFQHPGWLMEGGMDDESIAQLRDCIPPTFVGPTVIKETQSSGAKGINFPSLTGRQSIAQQFVEQRPVMLGGGQLRYIRMAMLLVGDTIGELGVTATSKLPVHGGDQAVNYHVNLRQ